MPQLTEQAIGCPYCGESITVLIDDSVAEQQYIEDCEVCCRPIDFHVSTDTDGAPAVFLKAEHE